MRLSLKPEYHQVIYVAGLTVLSVGLCYNNVAMSVGQLIMAGNWFWEGGFKAKLQRFFRNHLALALCSLFLVLLAGLIHTTNLDEGLHQLRLKLPLLILPFMIGSSKPLSLVWVNRILAVFVFGVFLATLICYAAYIGIVTPASDDIRSISIFISHIRFSLLISLASFFVLLFATSKKSKANTIGATLLIIWFIYFLIILESITGLFAITATSILLGFVVMLRGLHKMALVGFTLLSLLLVGLATSYLNQQWTVFYTIEQNGLNDVNKLEKFSPNGEWYKHYINHFQVENGNYIYWNIAPKELKTAWSKRSSMDYDGLDKKGQNLSATLLRFLTSKGLRKDAKEVRGLSSKEIAAIENGVANVKFIDGENLESRVYKIIWQFDQYSKGGSPAGNSVTQRVLYWKAAIDVIKASPFFGVGTGDYQDELNKRYSTLTPDFPRQYWFKPHNQFLTFMVMCGAAGLCWFLFTLIAPIFHVSVRQNYLYIAFLIIACSSMLSDDTLGTQAGATFFAFFNSFLLLVHSD